jgi:hypothetical protein
MNVDKVAGYLQHPLVFVGFAFFLAAAMYRFAGKKQQLPDVGKVLFLLILLTMAAVVVLKKNDLSLAIPAFIGLLQVAAGAALNWKPAAKEADHLSTKSAESPAVKAGGTVKITYGNAVLRQDNVATAATEEAGPEDIAAQDCLKTEGRRSPAIKAGKDVEIHIGK